MGVRTLVGQADGTTDAAAMYCSTTGVMVGPIFEAPDAAEQIDSFVKWLDSGAWRPIARELGFVPLTALGGTGDDPRCWTDDALMALVSRWRAVAVGDDGWLLDPFECACGPGHTHMGERGETARHGECVYEKQGCACTTWTPGNKAAALAAEGD
jgi:hypothetical protein